jgi:hypothetical protein
MPRRFTLAEAQSLIPEVSRLLREAITLKTGYEEAEHTLQEWNRRITFAGGMVVDRERSLDARRRRDAFATGLRNAIEQVQATGCLVKDLDSGLIDFPALFRGEEVYLCWKLGEPEIAFWHGVDEGFKGRKAIDRDFLDHHSGDPET